VRAGGSFRSRNPVVLGRGSIPHLLVSIGIFLIFDGLIFFNLSFLIFKYIIKIVISDSRPETTISWATRGQFPGNEAGDPPVRVRSCAEQRRLRTFDKTVPGEDTQASNLAGYCVLHIDTLVNIHPCVPSLNHFR
jgi:hypothetical protein